MAGTIATPSPAIATRNQVLIGRILTGLICAFTIFDGVTKVMQVPQVVQASAQLGYPEPTIPWIGATLLVCTLLFAIPRTSVLGAMLLTAYLGGAVATMVRAQMPLYETAFPIVFGVLVWAAMFLREARLRTLVPRQ